MDHEWSLQLEANGFSSHFVKLAQPPPCPAGEWSTVLMDQPPVVHRVLQAFAQPEQAGGGGVDLKGHGQGQGQGRGCRSWFVTEPDPRAFPQRLRRVGHEPSLRTGLTECYPATGYHAHPAEPGWRLCVEYDSSESDGTVGTLSLRVLLAFPTAHWSRVRAWLTDVPRPLGLVADEPRPDGLATGTATSGNKEAGVDGAGGGDGKERQVCELWTSGVDGWVAREGPLRLDLPEACLEAFGEALDDARVFFDSAGVYERMGERWSRRVLVEGPPGSGKTRLVSRLAADLGRPLYLLQLTQTGLEDNAFRGRVDAVPPGSVLLLDDLDYAYGRIDDHDGSSVSVSCLLGVLKGLMTPRGVWVVMACRDAGRFPQDLCAPETVNRRWALRQKHSLSREGWSRLLSSAFPESSEEQRQQFARAQGAKHGRRDVMATKHRLMELAGRKRTASEALDELLDGQGEGNGSGSAGGRDKKKGQSV